MTLTATTRTKTILRLVLAAMLISAAALSFGASRADAKAWGSDGKVCYARGAWFSNSNSVTPNVNISCSAYAFQVNLQVKKNGVLIYNQVFSSHVSTYFVATGLPDSFVSLSGAIAPCQRAATYQIIAIYTVNDVVYGNGLYTSYITSGSPDRLC